MAVWIKNRLYELADSNYAVRSTRFFKTGPGDYAEHDKFLGIRVPALRALLKECKSDISLEDCCSLLQNEWHEIRLFALLGMVELFQRGDEKHKRATVSSFFKYKKYINNWDLVDASAYKIAGAWHYDKDRTRLNRMITAKSLWERRIPVISTFYYIKNNDLDDTYRYSKLLFADPEDLIHKATGWMLREAGKMDRVRLVRFLQKYHTHMPAVMLSYASEKLSASEKHSIKT